MAGLIEERDGGVRVTLRAEDAAGVSRLDALGFGAALARAGAPVDLKDLPDGGLTVDLPGHPEAVAFLSRCLPHALAGYVRGLATCGDIADASVNGHGIDLDVSYVGDAGGGEIEPHDAVWSDSCRLLETLREAGFDAEVTGADHDSFSARLVPALDPAAGASQR